MKANEVPDKIYISVIPSKFGGNKTITCSKDFPNAVEYTRTDAFIGRACEYIKEHLFDYWSQSVTNESKFIEDFKKYMKGE